MNPTPQQIKQAEQLQKSGLCQDVINSNFKIINTCNRNIASLEDSCKHKRFSNEKLKNKYYHKCLKTIGANWRRIVKIETALESILYLSEVK